MGLYGIEENTSEETKTLAYNCRKFCRKYYRDQEFLKLIDETKGSDPDIDYFIQKFSEVIVPHYQKKNKNDFRRREKRRREKRRREKRRRKERRRKERRRKERRGKK